MQNTQDTSLHITFDREYYLFEKTIDKRGLTTFVIEEDTVIIPFVNDGIILLTSDSNQYEFTIRTNIWHLPAGIYHLNHKDAVALVRIVCLRAEYIKLNIDDTKIHRLTDNKNITPLLDKPITMGKKQHQIVNEIYRSTYPDNLKYLIIKNKILELLLDKFLTIENKSTDSIKISEIERVKRIRQILEERYHENITIQSIAREIGTNEQYVKKHFKTHIGSTIFNYLLACRMRRAKELIMTRRHKISDIAAMTGFKHATHFTTTFKKYFGFKPTSIKYIFFYDIMSSLTLY